MWQTLQQPCFVTQLTVHLGPSPLISPRLGLALSLPTGALSWWWRKAGAQVPPHHTAFISHPPQARQWMDASIIVLLKSPHDLRVPLQELEVWLG